MSSKERKDFDKEKAKVGSNNVPIQKARPKSASSRTLAFDDLNSVGNVLDAKSSSSGSGSSGLTIGENSVTTTQQCLLSVQSANSVVIRSGQQKSFRDHNVMHRKSSYQMQHSHSFRSNCSNEMTNIIRIRNSTLGKSAPSLSPSVVSVAFLIKYTCSSTFYYL